MKLLLPAVLLLALSAAPAPALEVSIPRDGLPHVFAKLKAGKPVTIAWFGGSITEGAGASAADKTSYRARVGDWFAQTFPKARVVNVNAAIGGTGSDLGAFRLGRDVLPRKPDLVFVEYAVNDGGTADALIERAMEGIVRQLRRADSQTDICFVYTFTLGSLGEFEAGRLTRPAARDELVAAHYGIPSVNVALPAARKLLAGALTKDEFSHDGVHPTDAGYQIYADALIGFLESEAKRKNALKPRARPAPLRADSLEHARMLGPDTLGQGVAPGGWAVSADDPSGRFGKVFAASTPGAEFSAAFSGPILAMFYVLGPDTGAFDYRIDDGGWKTLDPFDSFAKGYARAHYRLLEDGLTNGPHTVRFKVRAEHNPDSKGTVTRLGYLLVNPPR